METPLATLRPSPARLFAAVLCLAGLAAALLWIALVDSRASFGWRGVLGMGAALLAMAGFRLLRLRDRALVLTETALTDTGSGVVCRIADIARVDTGAFAFKPVRGLAIALVAPGDRAWVPGLWWRVGRSIGVGGMTSPLETRMMAESLAALVAARGTPSSARRSRPGSAARSGGSSPRSRSGSSPKAPR